MLLLTARKEYATHHESGNSKFLKNAVFIREAQDNDMSYHSSGEMRVTCWDTHGQAWEFILKPRDDLSNAGKV